MSVEERRVKSTVIRRRTKGIMIKPSSEMASKADKASDFFKSFLLVRRTETKGNITENADYEPSEPQNDEQPTDTKTSESSQSSHVIFVPDTNFFIDNPDFVTFFAKAKGKVHLDIVPPVLNELDGQRKGRKSINEESINHASRASIRIVLACEGGIGGK